MQLSMLDMEDMTGKYFEEIKKYPVVVQEGLEAELISKDTYSVTKGELVATMIIKDAPKGNGKGDYLVLFSSQFRGDNLGYIAGDMHLWMAREVSFWLS